MVQVAFEQLIPKIDLIHRTLLNLVDRKAPGIHGAFFVGTFTVDVSNLGSEFTLGATADSPTAVEALSLSAQREVLSTGALALGALLALGAPAAGLAVWRQR